jgi:hypothetical protein
MQKLAREEMGVLVSGERSLYQRGDLTVVTEEMVEV